MPSINDLTIDEMNYFILRLFKQHITALQLVYLNVEMSDRDVIASSVLDDFVRLTR